MSAHYDAFAPPPLEATGGSADATEAASHIASVTLDQGGVKRWGEELENELRIALYELQEGGSLRVKGEGALAGPYALTVAAEGEAMRLEIAPAGNREGEGEPVVLCLSFAPFTEVVRDYFQICQRYFTAIRSAPGHEIEAIDMARRGLHEQGAALVTEQIGDHVAMQGKTARRLFTLLCALQFGRL